MGFNPDQPYEEVEPVTPEPVAQEPVAQEPVVEEPVVEEPSTTGFNPDQSYEVVNDTNTPPPTEEKPGISSTLDKVGEFFTEPNEKKTDAYKEGYDKQMAIITAENERVNSEQEVLDQEAQVHRNKKFSDAPESDLESYSSYVPTFLSAREYSTKSMNGNYKVLKANGTVKNVEEYSEYLRQNGATVLDIQNFNQSSRGVTTSDEIFGETIGLAPAAASQFIDKRIIEPKRNASIRTQLAVGSVLVDLAKFVPLVDDETVDNAEQELIRTKGFLDAIEKDYENKYGSKSIVQSSAELIPLVALAVYSPMKKVKGVQAGISWTKLAFADGVYAAADSRGRGYDKIQAGAHGVVAAGVTRTLGKVFDVGSGIYKSMKASGKQFDDFKSISDLPTRYQKQIRQIQKENGWTDDEVMSMVKGYKDGVEGGEINAIDSIRLMAQNSHSSGARQTFKDTLLGNPKTARQFLEESTSRSDSFLKVVSRESTLGKIIHKNTFTKFGKTSINWDSAYREALDKGINPDSIIMKRLESNANIFDDFDQGYHKVLVTEGMGDVKTFNEKAVSLGGDLMEVYLGKAFANMMGTSFFANMGPPKMVAKFLKETLSGKGKIATTISESLESGNKINTLSLKKEIKKGNPDIPDDVVDDIVEEIVKASQKGKRQLLKEKKERNKKRESELKSEAKATKATEEAVVDATKSKEANDLRIAKINYSNRRRELEKISSDASKAEKEAARVELEKARKVERDADKAFKDKATSEKAQAVKEEKAAKVNYKARQIDIKKSEAKETEIAENKRLEIKSQEADAKQVAMEEKATKTELANQEKAERATADKAAKVTYKAKQSAVKQAEKELQSNAREIAKAEKAVKSAKNKEDRATALADKKKAANDLKIAKINYAKRRRELVEAKKVKDKSASDMEKARRKAQSDKAKKK